MRTTLILDDDLMAEASEYTGLKEKSAMSARPQGSGRARGCTPPCTPGRQRARLGHAETTAAIAQMILVDTPVWIDHLRAGDETLASLLQSQQVLIHPFVLGEIALGNLPERDLLMRALHRIRKPALPRIMKSSALSARMGSSGSGSAM
jgi:hypothetical protein